MFWGSLRRDVVIFILDMKVKDVLWIDVDIVNLIELLSGNSGRTNGV